MNKWQERAVKALMNEGYDSLTASRLYHRAYQKLSPKLLATDFNREFEAYASLVVKNNFIKFDIRRDKLYVLKTGEEVNSNTFAKAHTINRLSSLGAKYLEVNEYIEQYIRGDITLNELNEKIRQFKKSNAEYHKEGS